MLLQAYLWCDGPGVPQVLPAVLDMPPVLVYATYNLLNWRLIADPLPAAPIPPSAAAAAAAASVAAAAAGSAAPVSGAVEEQPKIELGNVVCLHVSKV